MAFIKALVTRLILGCMIVAMSGLAIGCTPVDPMVTQLPRAAQSAIASTAAVEPTAVEGSAQITADLPADVAADVAAGELATATFAGGCFWCMEQPFDQLPGVVSTTSGYTGGQVENPSYAQVSAGETGHVEAMQVRYDPAQVSYETLLETFWHNIDPLDNLGQFCDKGSQYRSVVFYGNAEQQRLAEASKAAVAEKLNQPVATDILPADPFYNAEDYHQDYYKTRPVRYKVYRFGCGRDQRLSELWGAPAHD